MFEKKEQFCIPTAETSLPMHFSEICNAPDAVQQIFDGDFDKSVRVPVKTWWWF